MVDVQKQPDATVGLLLHVSIGAGFRGRNPI